MSLQVSDRWSRMLSRSVNDASHLLLALFKQAKARSEDENRWISQRVYRRSVYMCLHGFIFRNNAHAGSASDTDTGARVLVSHAMAGRSLLDSPGRDQLPGEWELQCLFV
jgi:hypothetical protein